MVVLLAVLPSSPPSTILSLYLLVLFVSLCVVRWCPPRLVSAMGARLCCLSPCSSSWTGAYVHRRKQGHGTFHHNNGDVYEGDFEQDQKHGKGTLRWSDGAVYDGDWWQDKQHGQGVWKAATSSTASGAAANSTSGAVAPATRREDASPHTPPRASPDASLSSSTSDPPSLSSIPLSSYSGEWVSGERSGSGVLIYSDGSMYTGSFLHDAQSGQGELIRKDGSCYCGEWRDGKFHGQGLLTKVNGDVLEGRFVRGLLEGQGKVRRYCGDELAGSFVKGVLKGQGELRRRVHREEGGAVRKPTMPSPRSRSASVATSRSYEDFRGEREPGEVEEAEGEGWLLYKGEVSAAFEMQGWGTIFFPSGDSVWAQWDGGCGLGRDGQRDERMYCVYTYANGDVWDGDMRGWRRDGTGELRYHDGRLYTGDAVDDRKHGHGTYEDDDGLYSGGWDTDEKHGDGVLEHRDGRRYEGAFSHDRRHGKGVLYFAQPRGALPPHLSPPPSSPTSTPNPPPEDLFISEWRDDQPLHTSTSLRLAPLRLLQQRLFHLEEAMAELDRESEAVDPARLCLVCGERERSVLFLECRHLLVCDTCARGTKGGALSECPYCHATVSRIITVHES